MVLPCILSIRLMTVWELDRLHKDSTSCLLFVLSTEVVRDSLETQTASSSLLFPSFHFAKPSKAPSGNPGRCAALLAEITFSPGLLSLSSVNSPVIHCFNSSLLKERRKRKQAGGGKCYSTVRNPFAFAFLKAHCKQIVWTSPNRGHRLNELISKFS